ncbi:MAG: RHS repeat-associated core domain-containing protein [Microscillaceae bacterium]|nr:RHS repeat-associated core domain-containing protein [Microscillaceae bacterium]
MTDSDGNTLQNNSSLVNNLRVGLGYVPSSQPQSGEIKAYLQYLFYDQNNKYIGGAKKYVNGSIAGQSSGVGQSLGFENSQAFEAPENGYIEIFVANEGNEDVWFDDLEITVDKALITQENHYYPFGLNIVSLEKKGEPNHKFQWNKMSEKNTEFGLNWYETKFRTYDIQLGRWHQVDPKAEEDEDGVNLRSLSPYNAMGNDPVRYNDPDGDCPLCVTALIGAATGAAIDYGSQVVSNLSSGK